MRLRARSSTSDAARARHRRGGALLSLVALVGLGREFSSQAKEPPGQSRADYKIDARFDGETKKLAGRLTLHWTNQSGEPVSDLWFHLYLNAFSNNRSTHLVESAARAKHGAP